MQKTMIKINLVNPEEIYQSIKRGKPFNKELKLFSKAEVESAIRQFVEDEQYEKCSVLKTFIDSRYNHNSGWSTPITF